MKLKSKVKEAEDSTGSGTIMAVDYCSEVDKWQFLVSTLVYRIAQL